MTEELIFALAVCAAASFVGAFTQRVSGFGYGIIVMIFFTQVLMHKEAQALAGIISLFSAAYVAFTLRKNIKYNIVFLPLLTYTLVNILAITFVKSSNGKLLNILLGCALILLSIYFFFFNGKIKIKATPTSALTAGAVSGAMSGLFAMGGPPMVIYFLSACNSNDEYLATIQMFFALSNVISGISRAVSGFYTQNVLIMIIPAFLAMILANYLGKKVYGRLSPAVLKKVVYAFMAVSGVITIVKAII